jgi:hypothetical protein
MQKGGHSKKGFTLKPLGSKSRNNPLKKEKKSLRKKEKKRNNKTKPNPTKKR